MSDNQTIQQLRRLLANARAIHASMRESKQNATSNFMRYRSYKIYAEKYNAVAKAYKNLSPSSSDLFSVFDLSSIRSPNELTTGTHQAIFNRVDVNLSILISTIETQLGEQQDEVNSLADFFKARLRSAVFETPEQETQIQNAVEGLLIGRGLTKGIDYDREVGRIKVSIKETIPDFIMPRLSLAIEIKLSKTKSKSKTIVDEINADILAYKKTYNSIIFVVYDLATIRDETEFKQDITSNQGVLVVVVKH